jgi:hypothetical protein
LLAKGEIFGRSFFLSLTRHEFLFFFLHSQLCQLMSTPFLPSTPSVPFGVREHSTPPFTSHAQGPSMTQYTPTRDPGNDSFTSAASSLCEYRIFIKPEN